ncbi:hypothetical protein SKAU_G00177530 [Synaphobranchus kaupii]|uniref:Uncharacterized protein n=1 Tax=Synaphobranchus kaupii TaxID=118154 RepID=A0A9Q1FLZ0_SYNKA|nr:hypothetical protein SKAU_G00177530 [Synaphobranchus kaupii]
MSWLLWLWISVSALLLCQATLYDTIQQHHLPQPGRNTIQILGFSGLAESGAKSLHESICPTRLFSLFASHTL